MKTIIVMLLVILIPVSVVAQEPVGCDKFKWPLDKERTLLTSAGIRTIASGGEIDHPMGSAAEITLAPLAAPKLPMPPERAPKSASTFAGFVRIAGLSQPGSYKINLSGEAWIDVVHNGHYIKSGPFSGALGCEGVRKSVKFELPAGPFVGQVSGVAVGTIRMVITPATE